MLYFGLLAVKELLPRLRSPTELTSVADIVPAIISPYLVVLFV
jgi:hypothetical protein